MKPVERESTGGQFAHRGTLPLVTQWIVRFVGKPLLPNRTTAVAKYVLAAHGYFAFDLTPGRLHVAVAKLF